MSTKFWQVEPVAKNKKSMGVQPILLSPNNETKALLEYLCEQSGKVYNHGVYFPRQTFFKTGKLLTNKFDLIYAESVSKTPVAQSMPSTPMQPTLMSVTEGLKSFKELRSCIFNLNYLMISKALDYLKLLILILEGKNRS